LWANMHNSRETFAPLNVVAFYPPFLAKTKFMPLVKQNGGKKLKQGLRFCTVRCRDKEVVNQSVVPTKMCQVVKIEGIVHGRPSIHKNISL